MPTPPRPEPSAAAARAPARHPTLRRLFLFSFAMAILAAGSAAAALPEHVPGELLLKLRRTATSTEATSMLEALGGSVVDHRGARGLVHLRGIRLGVEDAIARYRSDPAVEWIEPNYVWHADAVPDDPQFAQQWALHNTGQSGGTPGADIDATLAWDRDTGSDGVLVAVIDTGMDLDHPDLMANRFVNPGEIASNGLDDDANGYVDDVFGWDFVDHDATPTDPHGHGTHCSGILGAVGDNGIGIAGVAWHLRILPVRFLDANGIGTTTGAVDAIDYAVAMGARVLSNSWGGGPDSQALFEAVARAAARQVLFVAAAGNEHRDNDVTPNFPSEYATRLPNVVSVAATDDDDQLATFSNFGTASVHLAAPGVDILSTWRNGLYERISGTSMAAPHVSGALALALNRYPGIGAQAARELLMARAEPLPSLAGRVACGGRLNLARLLSDPDTQPPAAISDLRATPSATRAAVELRWTAVGDDGLDGTADRHEIRYAAVPAAAFDWDAATVARGGTDALPSGSAEQATVENLGFDAVYTFEVRAVDEFGNFGPVSSRAEARTLGPPRLIASEDSLRYALTSGQGESRAYTVENAGVSDLILDVELDRGPAPTAPMRLLVLHSAGNVSEIRSLLASYPEVERVDTYNARLSTPSIAELRYYDTILLVATQPFKSPVTLGNALAEFVDAGGGVVVSIGAFVTRTAIEGRFRTDGYLPFRSTSEVGNNTSLGAFDPEHPILRGVTDVTTAVNAFCDPSPDATVVAWWRNGNPFVAVRGRGIAGLNAYFGAVAAWDLEMPVVVLNSAEWVRNSGAWLTSNRSRIVVPAGGRDVVTLSCSAVPRVEGRYGATVRLRTNDPARPLATVGATLNVTGVPGFQLSPGSLADDTVFADEVRRDTLSVFNPGTAAVSVRVAVDDPHFTTSFASARLLPGERRSLIVTFHSADEGRFTGTVTVEPDGGLPAAAASATRQVVRTPRLELSVAPIEIDLDAGARASVELPLRNTGGAPLRFHVNANGDPDAAATLRVATGDAARGGDAPVLGRATPLDLASSEAAGLPARLRFGAGGTPAPSDPGDAGVVRDGEAASGLAGDGVDDDDGALRRAGGVEAVAADAPSPGEEVFGGRSLLFTGLVRWRGNAYRCTRDMTLREHRFYFALTLQTDLWFAVYEGDAPDGAFRLVSVSRIPRGAPGEGWYSSGDVDVPMRAGRHYLMLTQFRQAVRYWGKGGLSPFPVPASFGELTAPVGFQWSPDAMIPPDSVMEVSPRLYGPSVAYYQTLVTAHPAPWFAVTPRQGSVAAGDEARLTVAVDATDAFDGTLAGRLAIDSDDPRLSRVEVPVRVRVHGVPALQVSRAALDLGDVLVGETRAESVELTNPGTAPLDVTATLVGDAALALSPSTLRLAPHQRAALALSFAPTQRGTVTASITLASNDPARPVTTVAVTARALPPPRLALAAPGATLELSPGTTGAAEVAIENPGESDLRWAFTRGAAAVPLPPTGLALGHDLATVNANLAAHGGEIERAIPSSVTFPGGESGERIDGGLFFGGNFILTDRSNGMVPYTGGRIERGDDWFGAGTSYFTDKRPGLFLLVADLAGVGTVSTDGQLITGATTVDGGSLDVPRDGVVWRVLFRRSWGGPGVAVTRMLLVANAPGATQSLPTDPSSDLHEVSGLDGATRVYLLLFANAPGTLVTSADVVRILDATLGAAGLPPPWLRVDPGSGTVAPGARGVARLTLDARGLAVGRYDATLSVASNVPGAAPMPFAVGLRVAEIARGELTVTPRALSRASRGEHVTAFVELPADVATADLAPGTPRLAGVEARPSAEDGRRLAFRVDREALVAALPAGERVAVTFAADLRTVDCSGPPTRCG